VKLFEKRFDCRFVAFEEYPLSYSPRSNQARFVKRGKVSRDRGLRHIAARVDLSGAHAIRERKVLFAEIRLGLLQPDENFASDGVRQGFVNSVDIHENG